MKKAVLLIAILYSSFCMAQLSEEEKQKIDSLQSVIENADDDSVKIMTYLSWEDIVYVQIPEKSKEILNTVISISTKNSNKPLTPTEKLFYTKAQAAANNGLGLVASNTGEYGEAAKYFHKSLKLYEQAGLKKGIGNALNNIGLIYDNQSDYAKAIEYYNKSLNVRREDNDDYNIAQSLNNIGSVYDIMGEKGKALEYYQQSLRISKDMEDRLSEAHCLNNIGALYYSQGKYKKAIEYFKHSMEILEDIGEDRSVVISLNNIAAIYHQQGDLDKAIQYSTQSLQKASAINSKNEMMNAYGSLSKYYSEKKQFEKSLKMYDLHIKLKDSLLSEKNQKETIRQEYDYEYDKKEAVAEAEHRMELKKQEELAAAEQKKQNIIIGAIAGGLALVIIFSIFLFQRFQVTKKQKAIIEEQKQTVDNAYGELEEKNKEITDSITYAKRIQEAILPPAHWVKSQLPDSFILYKPKDIVAGDFYWMEAKGTTTIFAAADCTGHGVPGAMVSVVCNNALNRSVREFELTQPGNILDKTRELVIETFEASDKEVKDGMDIALCSLSLPPFGDSEASGGGGRLQYAGANNPLWIIRKGEIIETKANKQPIGQFDNPLPYTTHSFDLQKNDTIYIFSDGYVDQFGGENGKKLKAKAFRELLLSIQDKPMSEQKFLVDNAFEKWKGNLEQIDDVCVIGVRI